MTSWQSVALVSALAVLGCKSKDKGSNGEDKDEPAAESPAAAKDAEPDQPSAKSVVDQKFEAAGLSLGAAPLDGWDLPDQDPSFLGFSKDGSLYAVQDSFGHEEEPGFAPFWVTFIELRDVHTGEVVQAFQGEPFESESWPPGDIRPGGELETRAHELWKTLPPKEAADAELKKLGVADPKASRKGPEDLRIEAEVEGKAPKGSRFVVKPVASGYEFRWDRIKRGDSDDSRGETYAPSVEVRLAGGKGAATLLTMRPRTSYQDLQGAADTRMPHLSGKIRAFWAPGGKRVAIEVSEDMQDQHEEFGQVGRTSTYVRAVGPQIKILDAGAGHEAARKAAALFDKEGLEVTVVEASDNQAVGVQLYYRGEAGKQAAEAAAELFDGPRVEELKKAGWVDLIVVLGAPGDPAAAGSSGDDGGSTAGGESDEGDEGKDGSCELAALDIEALRSQRAPEALNKKIAAELNKHYEGDPIEASMMGPTVKAGKVHATPMKHCDGTRCAGRVKLGKRWVEVPAFTEGVDGHVDFHDTARTDIDGDGKPELFFTWTNLDFGGGAGMEDQWRFAVLSPSAGKVLLTHDFGTCKDFEIRTGPASCKGGARVVASCGDDSTTYVRPAKSPVYREK